MNSLETGLAILGPTATIAAGVWALFIWKYPSLKDMKSDRNAPPNPKQAIPDASKTTPMLSKPAARLVDLFDLVNEGRISHPRFTEEKFSELMGAEDLTLFSEIRAGIQKPLAGQLKMIAEAIGANVGWLTSTQGGYTGQAPFITSGSTATGVSAILRILNKDDVSGVHLTHCPEKNGASGVVIALRNNRFIPIKWTVELRKITDENHLSQMVEFDNLIGEIMALSKQKSWTPNGCILKKEKFTRLHNGEAYPEAVIRATSANPWYWLFHDTTRTNYAHVDVASLYGDYFVEAQAEVARAKHQK